MFSMMELLMLPLEISEALYATCLKYLLHFTLLRLDPLDIPGQNICIL